MQRLLQFTLDLFESAPATRAAPPASREPPPKQEEKWPLAHVNKEQLAIEIVANNVSVTSPLAPQTLHQALAPATFVHPRAARQALLDGIVVGYAFRRGKRRSIGFSVCADGLAVSAPKWVPLHEIDKAVLEKSGWIIRKLQETRQRHERLESARIDWKDGATLPFLGETVTLVIESRLGAMAMSSSKASANAQLHTDAQALPGEPRQTLSVSYTHLRAHETDSYLVC